MGSAIFFYFFSSTLLGAAGMVLFTSTAFRAGLYLMLAFISTASLFVVLKAEFLGFLLLFVSVGAIAVSFLFVAMKMEIKEPQPQEQSRMMPRLKEALKNNGFLLIALCGLGILWLFILLGLDFAGLALHLPSGFQGYRFVVMGAASFVLFFAMPIYVRAWFVRTCKAAIHPVVPPLFVSFMIGGELILAVRSFQTFSSSEGFSVFPMPSAIGASLSKALGNLFYTETLFLFQLSGLILLGAIVGAVIFTQRPREAGEPQDFGRPLPRSAKESLGAQKPPLPKGF